MRTPADIFVELELVTNSSKVAGRCDALLFEFAAGIVLRPTLDLAA